MAIGYGVGGQSPVLPFGLRSAPAIFSAVADAVVRDNGVRNLDH